MHRKKMHKSKGKWVTISTSLVASLMVGASAQTIASAQEDASLYTYSEDESISENQILEEDTYIESEAEWVEYSTETPAVVEEIMEAAPVADLAEANEPVQNIASEPEAPIEMEPADTIVEEQAIQEIPVTEENLGEIAETEVPVELAEVTEPASDIELPTNSEADEAEMLVEETEEAVTPQTEAPVEETEEVAAPEAETPAEEPEAAVTPEAEAPVEETEAAVTPEAEAPVEEPEAAVTPEAEAPVEEPEAAVTPEAEAPGEETEEATKPETEAPVEETEAAVTPEAETPVEETEAVEAPEAAAPVEEIEAAVTPETEAPVEETEKAVAPEAAAPVEETEAAVTPEAEAPVEETEVAVAPEAAAPVEETEAPTAPTTPVESNELVDTVKEKAPVKAKTETEAPTVAPAAKPVAETQATTTTKPTYTISQGDTLWSLARKNNVSVSQLKEWNNLTNDSIVANASLIVANPTSNAVTSNDQKRQTETATKPALNSAAVSQQSSAYTISAGDTLYSIARRNNVSVANLREWNNLTSDTIHINGNLVVSKANHPANPAAPHTTDNTPSYTVSRGDTLWSIARRNNVSVAQLQEWNNLSSNSIFANQNLVVSRNNNADQPSSGDNTTAPTETKTKTHTVNRGEYLYSIARQHGVTVNQLREWNKLSSDNVHPNERLVVSKPGTVTGGNSDSAKPETKPEVKPADQDTPAADNANKQAVIDWFKEREGKVTYSMTNRMGPDSYDCSSAVFFALMEAGYLPDGTWPGTTESLYALEGSLFSPISRDEVQAGDIFVAGHKGFSLGSGGHTGVAVSNQNIIHSNYSDNGISTTPIEGYTSYAGMPTYWYRLMEN